MLQGTRDYNILVLGLYVILLAGIFLIKKSKIRIPQYYILGLIIYLVYLFIGVLNGHENLFIDVKFQLFAFIFFICIINLELNFKKLLFTINKLVFAIYILLYFNLIPNIWGWTTFGFGDRMYGPAIIAINLLLFYYLLNGMAFDKKLIIASFLGFIYIALSTNFMNLAIFIVLGFLLMVNLKKLLKPIYIISFLCLIVLGIAYLNSPFVPELVTAKLQYVFKPWEYPSLKTRIDDFNQIVSKEDFGIFKQIFGEGFGTSSQIYRYNPIAVSLSRTFSFQEIDNGFYYIYHRGGWTLLSIFILAHLYLMLRIKKIKSRIGYVMFVFITCILSIHYFNYTFYLLIPFFILYNNKFTKHTFS